MPEKFDYQAVKDTMNNKINEERITATNAVNNGTEIIDRAFGLTTGQAMSGAAAASVKNKWNNLQTEVDNFVSQINTLIEEVNQASANFSSYEDYAASLAPNNQ